MTKEKTNIKTKTKTETKTTLYLDTPQLAKILVVIVFLPSKTPPLADSSTERDLLNDSEGEISNFLQKFLKK